MTTIAFRTLNGSSVTLDRAWVDSALDAEVLFPDSAGYTEARAIWNAMIERRPAAIVRVTTEADVLSAVEFARMNNVRLAVKGGGHNIAGSALADGGLVIDFSRMRNVDVDAGARIARVEPGATLADVDRATQQHGLAVPLGINSTTGIAGLTLGGGFGWTTRKLGLTIDNLRSARLVTADGEIWQVDRDRHPDLFWAIRGGGGNFGVVTEFEFNLHPIGPEVVAGMVVHPFADFAPVVKDYQRAVANAPEDLTCWVVARKAPPLPFLPSEWHGKEVVVLAMCYVGPREQAEAATAPLRKIGKPIADVVGPMPFAGWQSAFDPLLTPGARNYWKSHDVASFGGAAIEVIRDTVLSLPTEECEVFLAHVGGAMSRVAPAATPWANRAEHFVVNVHTRWRDAGDDERCRAWARRFYERLTPHAMGSVYVNFIPDDEARVAEAYGPNYERLAGIKRRFDPSNLFRANQNIVPR
ncbi:MAG TPA: FAD-binding oxidoreductase [Gammaproteobacteria bacterium]|nr:FAD-binding oxidoreductase [Gammaproteobacteria bacterium]